MFKKLFAAFSAKSKIRADAAYGTDELNTVHKMLFADDVGQLFGDAPDARVVQARDGRCDGVQSGVVATASRSPGKRDSMSDLRS